VDRESRQRERAGGVAVIAQQRAASRQEYVGGGSIDRPAAAIALVYFGPISCNPEKMKMCENYNSVRPSVVFKSSQCPLEQSVQLRIRVAVTCKANCQITDVRSRYIAVYIGSERKMCCKKLGFVDEEQPLRHPRWATMDLQVRKLLKFVDKPSFALLRAFRYPGDTARGLGIEGYQFVGFPVFANTQDDPIGFEHNHRAE